MINPSFLILRRVLLREAGRFGPHAVIVLARVYGPCPFFRAVNGMSLLLQGFRSVF